MIAVPPKPFTDAVSRAFVIGELDGERALAEGALDMAIERQLAVGADLVALTGDVATELPGAALRDRVVLDVGATPPADVGGATHVSGLVDRWDESAVDAVAGSGAVVLVQCAEAGGDDDPTLPRLRAGLERAIARLMAAGATPDRLVIDASAAPGTPVAGWVTLLRGHRHLMASAHPVVGPVPPASVLTEVAGALAPSVDDVEAAAVAVAAALAAAGCRGIRSAWPGAARRVVTVQAAIDGARR